MRKIFAELPARRLKVIFSVLFILVAIPVMAQVIPKVTLSLAETSEPKEVGTALQIVFLMTILALAPSILIMMTSFIRLIIVFSFIRRAMGLQTVPPDQVLVGLSLFLTFSRFFSLFFIFFHFYSLYFTYFQFLFRYIFDFF